MFTSRVSFLLPLLYVPFLFIYFFFYIFLNLHKFIRSTDVRPATDPPSSRIPPVLNWSTLTGRPQMKALVICFLLSPRLLRNFPCRFAFRAFVRDHGAERSGKKERKKGKKTVCIRMWIRGGARDGCAEINMAREKERKKKKKKYIHIHTHIRIFTYVYMSVCVAFCMYMGVFCVHVCI